MPKNGQKWDHKVQNPKKTPKTWRRMQRRFFVLCPFFYALKKFENTAFLWALWYKKRRVLSVLKILERGPKSWIFWVFCQKCEKVIFLENALKTQKKSFRFVTIKKTFFLETFRGFEFWTYFSMSKIQTLRKVSKKWILLFFVWLWNFNIVVW